MYSILKHRILLLMLFVILTTLVHGQQIQNQVNTKTIKITDSFQLSGLWVHGIATSGSLVIPDNRVLVTKKYLDDLPEFLTDTIATIDSVLTIKFTTGQKDSLLFPVRNSGLFLASPSTGSGRPVFRKIELVDLPAGIGGSQSLHDVIVVNNVITNDSIRVNGKLTIVEAANETSVLSVNSDSTGVYLGDPSIGDFLSWKKSDNLFQFRLQIANNPTYYSSVQSGYVLTSHDEQGHLSWQPPTKIYDSVRIGNDWFYTAKITLTPSQINSLFTSPVLAIPAPGANQVIDIISSTAYLEFNTTPYNSEVAITLFIDGASIMGITSTFILSENNKLEKFFNNSYVLKEASDVFLVADNDNSGGDSNIKINIFYRIINL